MLVNQETRNCLLQIAAEKRIYLEGGILKIIESDPEDVEFSQYLIGAIEKDKDMRRRRLDITKQIQSKNTELEESQKTREKLMTDLKEALQKAEDAREEALIEKEKSEDAKMMALNDLDVIQKRSQTELIGTIVKVALLVILSVGVITTGMYAIAMVTGKDTQIIGSTWSNMFGILLTNAFSIVGTIMGVKYANQNSKSSD
jgi:Fe2+ transport system protein B